MARIGHSAMTADELTENIQAAVKTVADKIRMVSVAGGAFCSLTGPESAQGNGKVSGIYASYFLLFHVAAQAKDKT